MAHISPTSLTTLCMFGADVGSRLVRLAKWVDGMPSSVKSLGYEIWAACEVLCELANILARAQKNYRVSFFNASTLKEIEDYLETCDEIFHEAARGVLVAYDRIKAIRKQEADKAAAKAKKDEMNNKDGDQSRLKQKAPQRKILTPEVISLSFQERAQWPLFQQRMKSMMGTLLDAKTDLTLHVMVYWVGWERENRRKSKSSIFSDFTSSNRDSLIDVLWHNKVRRDQELDSQKASSWSPNSAGSTKAPSIFALSNSGSSSPDTSTSSSPSSPVSNRSSDSLFKRLGKKLSRSSKKSLVAMGFIAKKQEFAQSRSSAETNRNHQAQTSISSRSPSFTQGLPSDQQSYHSRQPSMRRTQSSRPPLRPLGGGERYSLLSLTESQNSFIRPQTLQKRGSWCAGPTKSAKEGIVREWEILRINEDDLLWQNEEEITGDGQDFRELGHQLLFRQLQAQIPMWAVPDSEQVSMTVDMLVENWIEPGQFRQRRTEWENIVDGTRTNAHYGYVSADDVGRAGAGAGARPRAGTENKFLFSAA